MIWLTRRSKKQDVIGSREVSPEMSRELGFVIPARADVSLVPSSLPVDRG
jgi:hypothetical protein